MHGAIDAIKDIGGDTTEALKDAVTTAFNTAKEIGGSAIDDVESALKTGVDGADKIIDSIKK